MTSITTRPPATRSGTSFLRDAAGRVVLIWVRRDKAGRFAGQLTTRARPMRDEGTTGGGVRARVLDAAGDTRPRSLLEVGTTAPGDGATEQRPAGLHG